MWLIACAAPPSPSPSPAPEARPDSAWPAVLDWESPVSLVVDGQQVADQQRLELSSAPAGLDQPLRVQALLTNRSTQPLSFPTEPAAWLQSDHWTLDNSPPERLSPDQSATLLLSFNPVNSPSATTAVGTLLIPDQPLSITLSAEVPRPLRSVLVGDGGWWASSDDYGQSWQTAPDPTEVNTRCRTLVWGEGRFFRAEASSFDWSSTGQYDWSEDGQSWTSATATDDFWPSDCAFGNGLFSCLRDGVLSWSETGGSVIHEPTDYSDLVNAIVFVEDHFVGVGRSGRRLWSENGKNWLHQNNFADGDEFYSVAYDGSTLVAVGGSNRFVISTSLDGGLSWQDQVWGVSQYATLLSVVALNGRFYAQGQSNDDPLMWRSEDGLSWEAIPGMDLWESYYLLGTSNGWLFGVSGDSLTRSADGETWQSVLTAPEGVSLRALATEEAP